MAIKTIGEEELTAPVKDAISVCRSDSGICGTRLRAAHQYLGGILADRIGQQNSGIKKTALMIMMRAGLLFGLGLADGLEKRGLAVDIFFDTEGRLPAADYDLMIVADGVIRTGEKMRVLADRIRHPNTILAANVLDESGIPELDGRKVYAVRISKNSFIGAAQKTVADGKGPDTGDRLFSSDFLA